ncbi:hypothetical protein PCANC_16851 [Puccinia coronata f. sp. avenae]|uniref:Enoyl-CoA hydratase/isomerase domain-containing protein n=1 Tax=Puccinia coronata f. sp. avenae TaxID=200324 RepID=A0A2N5SSU9_9BASI|nr:hypothetical protein PCANC_16851 [Puccinia coronata f. sp. avenae]
MPHTIGSPMPLTSLRRTRTGRGIPAGRWISSVLKRQATDHCFAQNTVEKIVEGLKAVQDGHLFSEDPSLKAWAGETLDLIQIRSPSSCIITLMALREGKKVSIDVCFAMDMRQLAATCCSLDHWARDTHGFYPIRTAIRQQFGPVDESTEPPDTKNSPN